MNSIEKEKKREEESMHKHHRTMNSCWICIQLNTNIKKKVIHNILAGFSESSFRQIVMILNDIHKNDRCWDSTTNNNLALVSCYTFFLSYGIQHSKFSNCYTKVGILSLPSSLFLSIQVPFFP